MMPRSTANPISAIATGTRITRSWIAAAPRCSLLIGDLMTTRTYKLRLLVFVLLFFFRLFFRGRSEKWQNGFRQRSLLARRERSNKMRRHDHHQLVRCLLRRAAFEQ